MNPGGQLLADAFGIASALIGVALIALLVGNASKTAQVVNASAQGFNSLLQTVTLQGGFGSNVNMSY
jgi:hypothetical protein